MKIKINNLFSIIVALILCLAAIQNRFFDTILNVAGMDFVSLILSICLAISFGIVIYINKMKFTKTDLIINLYFAFFCIIGFIITGINSQSLLLFRTSMYFFMTFYIFKNMNMKDEKIIKYYEIAGILNTVFCLYFYFINIKTYGSGFRDVSMNLYFSVFALLFFLFVNMNNRYKITKYFICFIILIAIITSQQRTQIIPLMVTAIFYIISNDKFNLKSIFNILSIFLIVYLVIKLANNIGVFKLVVNRLSNGAITSEESTLWIRINTAKEYLNGMNIWNLLFGTGLFGKGELELFVPNYIYKYGILGSIFLAISIYMPAIKAGIKNKNNIKRFILISLLIMSIGGIISGFNGQNGQLLIASILGILLNNNIQMNNNINYNIKFMGKNKLER